MTTAATTATEELGPAYVGPEVVEDMDMPPGLPLPVTAPDSDACSEGDQSSLGDVEVPPGLGPRMLGAGRQVSAPPGLSLPEPRRALPVQRQTSDSPVGSLSEPEPEMVEADRAPSAKRFCVWCGKQVPPKLVSARFCVFCGGVHSGEAADFPGRGKPACNKPNASSAPKQNLLAKNWMHQQAEQLAAAALAEKARRQVALSLSKQSAANLAWRQSQVMNYTHGVGYFGEVVLPPSGVDETTTTTVETDQAWDQGFCGLSSFEDDGGADMFWAGRWERSVSTPCPKKMQYTNAGITPAMLYQMQADRWA